MTTYRLRDGYVALDLSDDTNLGVLVRHLGCAENTILSIRDSDVTIGSTLPGHPDEGVGFPDFYLTDMVVMNPDRSHTWRIDDLRGANFDDEFVEVPFESLRSEAERLGYTQFRENIFERSGSPSVNTAFRSEYSTYVVNNDVLYCVDYEMLDHFFDIVE